MVAGRTRTSDRTGEDAGAGVILMLALVSVAVLLAAAGAVVAAIAL